MHFGFIGMAGVGKSYWAEKLAAIGYTCFHCDDMIAEQLQAELGESLSTVHDLGNWMGFPHEQTYPEKEQKYLSLETQILQTIGDRLAAGALGQERTVIDMTGSAIYTGAGVLQRLRQFVTVVYFSVSADVHQQMLQEYIAQPRPVVWQGMYGPLNGESPSMTLARCYPQLIAQRERMYEEICDVKLDYEVHRRPGFTVDDFLAYVQTQLPAPGYPRR